MKKKSWFQNMLWLFFCISMLVASFAGSYIIMLLIYRLTEKPPEQWGYFIYGVINLLLIIGIIGVGAKINNLNNQPSFQKAILEALEKMAQGNFDVFIEHDVYGYRHWKRSATLSLKPRSGWTDRLKTLCCS